MRKTFLGLILALALVLTSPITAVEESAFGWPSFELFEWVFELFDTLSPEMSEAEMGPGLDPLDEKGSSVLQMGPEADPNGEKNPLAAEMGPEADPGGENRLQTSEMGPELEPNG